MNILDKKIVKRYDDQARLTGNITLHSIIEKQSNLIRRLIKPIYLSQEVNFYLSHTKKMKELKHILMGISGHLHSKYQLTQIISFNVNNEKVYESLVDAKNNFLDDVLVEKYASNLIQNQKISGEVILNSQGTPLWTVSFISQDVKNAKQFYHIFVFEIDQLIENLKRKTEGIHSIKIGGDIVFFKAYNRKLEKIGVNKYINDEGERFSYREINLGSFNLKKSMEIILLVKTDDLIEKFKKTRDYEIILLVLLTLFLIPSAFIFFLYHRSFFKLLKEAILKLEVNTNIEFTKNEYGSLYTNLNKLKYSISQKNMLIHTIADSGIVKFFYFDRLGDFGDIESVKCSQMISAMKESGNIFSFFKEFAKVDQKHTRNLVDLVWDSDSLVDFKALSEGFPPYIFDFENKKIELVYFPMFSDDQKLEGILVTCS